MDSGEKNVINGPQIKPIIRIGVICGEGKTAIALEPGLHEAEREPAYLVKILTQAINAIVSTPPRKKPQSPIIKPSTADIAGINGGR